MESREFSMKSLRFKKYNGSVLSYSTFVCSPALKEGFIGEDSGRALERSTFKGFVQPKSCLLSIWSHLDAISNLLNLLWSFSRVPLFLECSLMIRLKLSNYKLMQCSTIPRIRMNITLEETFLSYFKN